jgi:hypothetical protein
MKEIKSYRDDNKKLYDLNKKFVDENIKYQVLQKENSVMDNILLRLLKSHPDKNLAKQYNELINQNDVILNYENDNLRYDKVIEHLEKELNFLTNGEKVKRNPEVEKKIANEIERLKQLKLENEAHIRDKKDNIKLMEQDLKILEVQPNKDYIDSREVFGKNKEGNIFASNYTQNDRFRSEYGDNSGDGTLKKGLRKPQSSKTNNGMNNDGGNNNDVTVYDELENSLEIIKAECKELNFPAKCKNINFSEESSVEYNNNMYIPPSTQLYKKTYNVPFSKFSQ